MINIKIVTYLALIFFVTTETAAKLLSFSEKVLDARKMSYNDFFTCILLSNLDFYILNIKINN